MINSSEIFLTSDKSIFEFEDDYTCSGSIIYYRIVVEDIFGKQTPGNVISTSMSNMPLTWKIQSVQYTASSLSVFWSIPAFNNYVSHQLMYSENRDGVYDTLDSFTDSSIFQYQSIIPSINLNDLTLFIFIFSSQNFYFITFFNHF